MTDKANRGAKWTEYEEKQLLEERKTMTIEDIAKIHKRSVTGIVCRLEEIASKMIIKDGKSMEEAVAVTQLSKEAIDKSVKKHIKPPSPPLEQEPTLIDLKKQLDRIERKLDDLREAGLI